MAITLDGTTGITSPAIDLSTPLIVADGGTGTSSTTFTNLTTNVTGTLPVGNGGTGAATLTANNVILGNGTSAVSFVAPSTSGNVLTSNGTTWQSTAAGSMTLLGTIVPTAVNSISLSSLVLTSYQSLFIVFNNINTSGAKPQFFINQTSVQTGGGLGSNGAGPYYGTAWIDLSTGVIGGSVSTSTVQTGTSIIPTIIGGLTTVTTASTIIYFRAASTDTFTAAGSIRIYGVK